MTQVIHMRAVVPLTAALTMLLAALAAGPTAAQARGKSRLDGTERAIVRAVNHQRARHGLRPVRPSRGLARAADFHSREMLAGDYFAHVSRDGGSFDRRVRRFASHRTLGETLAVVPRCGRASAGTVVRMWMGSAPHRAILLDPRFRRVGVGKRTGSLGSGRRCVVTADFGSRR